MNNVTQGVIYSKQGVAAFHEWNTPMDRIEAILVAGRARAKANQPPPVPVGFKRCGDECQQILPATPDYFNKNKQTRLGVAYRCKICKSKRDKQKRLGNKRDRTIYLITDTDATTTTNQATATMMEKTAHYRRCTRDQYYDQLYQIRATQLKDAEATK